MHDGAPLQLTEIRGYPATARVAGTCAGLEPPARCLLERDPRP
ncbi:MAG TPA: hypothetical protein VK607_07125 [Kofleriaceae bacterium]|nr:hypothetical protein [Kofleriaceae bacterium]